MRNNKLSTSAMLLDQFLDLTELALVLEEYLEEPNMADPGSKSAVT